MTKDLISISFQKPLGCDTDRSYGCIHSFDLLAWQENKSYMALEVFREMRRTKCKPNICTYTALVNAFARDGLYEKAEEIFELMQEAGHEPDVYAYNGLMEAYR